MITSKTIEIKANSNIGLGWSKSLAKLNLGF